MPSSSKEVKRTKKSRKNKEVAEEPLEQVPDVAEMDDPMATEASGVLQDEPMPPADAEREEVRVEPVSAVEPASAVEEPVSAADAKPVAVVEDVKMEEAVVEEEPEPVDERPRLQRRVLLNPDDATINATFGTHPNSMGQAFSLHSLNTGARADTGVLQGKYAFECRVNFMNNDFELTLGWSSSSSQLFNKKGDQMKMLTFSRNQNKKLTKGDVVCAQLIRTPEGCKFQWYYNGELMVLRTKKEGDTVIKTTEMELEGLPEHEPLFPHVVLKGGRVTANFRSIMVHPMPKIRMLETAAIEDVCNTSIKKIAFDEHPTIVLPMTLPEDEEEFITSFCKDHPEYENFSTKTLSEWSKASNSNHQLNRRLMSDFFCHKNIILNGPFMNADERSKVLKMFPFWNAECHVAIKKDNEALFGKASMPTKEEGFHAIKFVTPEQEAAQVIKAMNDRSRKIEVVKFEPNLKEGWFADSWAKFYEVLKKNKKEEKYNIFTKEDWALVTIRYKIHTVLHAFQADSPDPERKTFAINNLAHYCSLYHKAVDTSFLNCQSFEEVDDIIPETFKLEDGMVLPVQEKDVSIEKFFELCMEEHESRQMRWEAGDETAKLTFAAQFPQKGGKGQTKEKQGKKVALTPNPNFKLNDDSGAEEKPRIKIKNQKGSGKGQKSGKSPMFPAKIGTTTTSSEVKKPFLKAKQLGKKHFDMPEKPLGALPQTKFKFQPKIVPQFVKPQVQFQTGTQVKKQFIKPGGVQPGQTSGKILFHKQSQPKLPVAMNQSGFQRQQVKGRPVVITPLANRPNFGSAVKPMFPQTGKGGGKFGRR